jgi:hypothetical protein
MNLHAIIIIVLIYIYVYKHLELIFYVKKREMFTLVYKGSFEVIEALTNIQYLKKINKNVFFFIGDDCLLRILKKYEFKYSILSLYNLIKLVVYSYHYIINNFKN